mmetsp:Transcript_15308/g.26966  ORF Transcript_15308/g.26966 Transcript_15308/m.26966 type:complete len:204 (+) Transcript_15308:142-753(+)
MHVSPHHATCWIHPKVPLFAHEVGVDMTAHIVRAILTATHKGPAAVWWVSWCVNGCTRRDLLSIVQRHFFGCDVNTIISNSILVVKLVLHIRRKITLIVLYHIVQHLRHAVQLAHDHTRVDKRTIGWHLFETIVPTVQISFQAVTGNPAGHFRGDNDVFAVSRTVIFVPDNLCGLSRPKGVTIHQDNVILVRLGLTHKTFDVF